MLGFQPVAALSGTFNWLNNPASEATSSATLDQNRAFNVSVIDGKNQYVNAGLSFTRRTDLDLVHVALAKRVLPWLSFGASGKRFATRSNTAAYAGQQTSGLDGGVSASIALPQEISSMPIQFGITADNLRHIASAEPYIGPKQLAGGVKANLSSILMLYGDLVENLSYYRGRYPLYSGGAEIALGGDLFARGGMYGFSETGWSAGGGWVGPKIGISYGYQNRHYLAERGFEHAVTMDLFM